MNGGTEMDVMEKQSSEKRLIDYYYLAEKIECPGEPIVYWHDIEAAPTVDAVPVVRCKDCKYHEDEEIGMVYCPNALGGWVAENWFCADGERKEG